jgi:hypothetical protein
MSQKSWHQLLQSKVDGSIHVVYNSIQTQAIFCSCIGWNLSPSPLYSYGICHHFLFFSIVMIMCFLMELLAMLSACSISSTVILGVTLGNCICSVLLIWNEACFSAERESTNFPVSEFQLKITCRFLNGAGRSERCFGRVMRLHFTCTVPIFPETNRRGFHWPVQ